MEEKECLKEVELAKRGVDAFVDRANELHHQGRHVDALKQLEVNLICISILRTNVDVACATDLREKARSLAHQYDQSALHP